MFQLACDGGEPSGCLELGRAYEAGRGAPHDDARAAAIYRRGCDGGNQAMCMALAALYEVGHGVAQDAARAAELYRAACPSEPHACTALARRHGGRRGVARDDKLAARCTARRAIAATAPAASSSPRPCSTGRHGARPRPAAARVHRR